MGRRQNPGLVSFLLWTLCCVFQPFVVLLVLAQSQKGKSPFGYHVQSFPFSSDFVITLFSGFINIDCGYTGGSSYVDSSTGLTYTDDSQFIDTGKNYLAASNTYSRQYGTLRSFPNSTRNCYKILPIQSGGKYLIRAEFYYGNYDGQSSPPHLRSSRWGQLLDHH